MAKTKDEHVTDVTIAVNALNQALKAAAVAGLRVDVELQEWDYMMGHPSWTSLRVAILDPLKIISA